jgi:hypothetical protein
MGPVFDSRLMHNEQYPIRIYIYILYVGLRPACYFFFYKNGERQKGGSAPPSEKLSVTTHLSYQHENQKQLQLFLE